MKRSGNPELLRDVLARSLPAALLEALANVPSAEPANENDKQEKPLTAAERGGE